MISHTVAIIAVTLCYYNFYDKAYASIIICRKQLFCEEDSEVKTWNMNTFIKLGYNLSSEFVFNWKLHLIFTFCLNLDFVYIEVNA